MTNKPEMRFILIILLTISQHSAWGQNDVHLFSGSGKPFRVLYNEKFLNEKPQADLFLRQRMEDTLQLKIEFEGKRYGLTLYLLDKGKPTSNKEFNYRVDPGGNRVLLSFMGMREIRAEPGPVVPDKPVHKK